jgi:hypothetical protein
MNDPDRWLDAKLLRRQVLARIAHGALGVMAVDILRPSVAMATPQRSAVANIITLFTGGGMSHIDTFDPKPGREEQGPTGVIRTSTPGIVFGAGLEQLAGMADRLAVLRAVTTQTGAHEPAAYLMRTGYEAINSIRHPSIGSWALTATGHRGALPGFVLVGNANTHPGCGFLDPSFSPVPVADASSGIAYSKRPFHLPEPALLKRWAIAERIDRKFKAKHRDRQVDAYDRMYAEAVRLLGSPDLEAFEISREPAAVRERYGNTPQAQACLLARRLVESGVKVVDIDIDGWDMHRDMYQAKQLPDKVATLDRALATLLDDLSDRGLLESTLVVLATEFGRTPKINENGGRDHHPAVFSCVLAGAGVKGGAVYGASDERGHLPDDGAISVADFNTTVAAAAGLPYEKEFHAPNGRPFKIGGGGKPVREVLA